MPGLAQLRPQSPHPLVLTNANPSKVMAQTPAEMTKVSGELNTHEATWRNGKKHEAEHHGLHQHSSER